MLRECQSKDFSKAKNTVTSDFQGGQSCENCIDRLRFEITVSDTCKDLRGESCPGGLFLLINEVVDTG